MTADYTWEDFSNPTLKEIRKQFKLHNFLKSKDEFASQLLLKEWVHYTLPNGIPETDYAYKSAIEILKDAQLGKKFWCTQYAYVYLQCASALGWYSRKLSIDSDHLKEEKDMHHGVIDIWSNQFNKWYVIDPQNNIHYEKEGFPLNSLEIRNEYLKNKAKDIIGIIGNRKQTVSFKEEDKGFNTPSNYFWFAISTRNNFLVEPGIFDVQMYLWVDNVNMSCKWHKGHDEHPMYKSQFIKTENRSLCFPLMSTSAS